MPPGAAFAERQDRKVGAGDQSGSGDGKFRRLAINALFRHYRCERRVVLNR